MQPRPHGKYCRVVDDCIEVMIFVCRFARRNVSLWRAGCVLCCVSFSSGLRGGTRQWTAELGHT